MLGVPVLLQIDKEYSVITEQQDAGLIARLRPTDDVRTALLSVLAESVEAFRRRSREYIATKGDVNAYVLSQIVRVATEQRTHSP